MPHRKQKMVALTDLKQLQAPATGPPTPEFVRLLAQQLLASSWVPLPEDGESPQPVTHVMPRALLLKIMREAATLLKKEPTLLELEPSGQRVTVVGDTHGQLHDLCNIFDKFGCPSADRIYVFNGDFVDRGAWGVETLALLLAWKWALPHNVFLVRGNHETTFCTSTYGFQSELASKYGDQEGKDLYDIAVTKLFPQLPLAVCVNGSTLILHGGLFRVVQQQAEQPGDDSEGEPQAKKAKKTKKGKKAHRKQKKKNAAPLLVTGSLQDLRSARKAREDPAADVDGNENLHELLASDLLWSDPSPHPGHRCNELRGIGSIFGPDVTEAFLSANGLKLIIRSHEGPDARDKRLSEDRMPSVDSGYSVDHETASGKLVTLFSAPDYPQFMAEGEARYNNQAAVLHLDAPGYHSPSVESFQAVLPRPQGRKCYQE